MFRAYPKKIGQYYMPQDNMSWAIRGMCKVIVYDFKDHHIMVEYNHPNMINWEDNYSNYMNSDDFYIMKSTGLLDNAGKPIYEGDIVEFETFYNKEYYKVKGIVKYHTLDAKFYIEKIIPTDTCFNEYDFNITKFLNVIGNIYENKELLNGYN